MLTAVVLLLGWCPQARALGLEWQLSLAGKEPFAMKMPTSVYVDAEKERYYVIDSGNNQLVSYDREGKLLSIFTASNELKRPFDLVRDQGGVLWVVEKGRNSLTSIDLDSKKVTPHMLKYRGVALYPDRLEFDNNLFYLLDKESGTIVILDQDLTVTGRITPPDPEGIFADFKLHNGTVFALDRKEGVVFQFGTDGTLLARIGLDLTMKFPVSLAVHDNGMFILDRHTGTVEVFSLQGQHRETFLGTGHVRGKLYYPIELQIDPWGRLCVVDEGNGRVEIFGY